MTQTMNLPPKAEARDERLERTRPGRTYRPQVDICETDQEMIVRCAVPGSSADAISVQFEKGELTIHAEVEPRGARQGEWLLREYGVGDYERRFTVGEQIASDRIGAEYRRGVLTLHLPKTEAAKPRKIQVASK
jgi:HSP20 family molecular chaperone IbpA